ncbi:MAG: bifunctional UDP-N-acetylglucosamine diphosphorylase/glucosamine-1-phosphate N-acetyltransferase GlmU [Chloroflexi bacterium]|nr:bifunctional UDP-N-acetylglucosamine diphosphorylase/glucosamine-1-phosphate N-acetyltransferase GlmU [Chloroflexota bacterium]MBU1662525.1 bifunctional UDP-N-acetylglucosamine diphosphorylase/glucosamine-1-phosphate N-acetyltransferase GlmU [Chloroflexota bacterium]
MKITPIILAAGQGTRMHSSLPKVLHPILGRPMVWYALEAAQEVTETKPVVVIGHGAEGVRQVLGDTVQFVWQEQRLGTGHAAQQAEPVLRGETDLVLVTSADMPLITSETLSRLVDAQTSHAGPITMLTVVLVDPHGFGRVIRADSGQVAAIIEEAQASPEQLSVRELNAGVYCFSADWLWPALKRVELSPKGEYYLTDLVGIAAAEGRSVQAIRLEDPTEMIGVNTRVHLAEATAIMQQRINRKWMLAGVSIVDPNATYIEPGITIGRDTVIWPNTYLQGETQVGESCVLGPNTIIRDTQLGNRCQVFASVLETAVVEDDVDIGPFGHLRKGAHLAQGVHIGNFGEVKNSYLGPGTKMGHFSYVGDTSTGPNVNIGAGTVTCNYDGEHKHPTKIGANVFIGSDTMLVAPLNIGDGSRTGAGSVVTKDVPSNTLVVGAPARAIRKLGA